MGTLQLVSTPIGNIDDITIRAIYALSHSDCICSEDTRRSGFLCDELRKRFPSIWTVDKKPHFVRLDDFSERTATPKIMTLLEQGQTISLVSDAGTPLISDPGYYLVSQAIKRSIPVIAIPGASAFLTALISSGLPANQFYFGGYLPDQAVKATRILTDIRTASEIHAHTPTIIFYSAPHKLQTNLSAIRTTIGNIYIVCVRELTKMHEELFRGTVDKAVRHFSNPRGEFVLLFSLDPKFSHQE